MSEIGESQPEIQPFTQSIRLLTSEQAGELLQINPRALEVMSAKGQAPGFKLGKFWRYREADLVKWIEGKTGGRE